MMLPVDKGKSPRRFVSLFLALAVLSIQYNLKRIDLPPNSSFPTIDDSANDSHLHDVRTSTGSRSDRTSLPTTARPNRRIKVLHGIFTADFESEIAYRKRHRDLFALWNDSRVCTLHDYLHTGARNNDATTTARDECELIYTFVLGANPNATTELLDDDKRPWLVSRNETPSWLGKDIDQLDVTHLNIRENMENGKSQSWFAYASTIAGIDYITKADSDTIISLHDFFPFAYRYMPLAPHNSMMLQCIPFNKNHWRKNDTLDGYFDENFNRVHNYCSGELYTMSVDLAMAVTLEARALNGTCPYCGGREDHDVTTMAFHVPHPIKFVMMHRRHHVYWTHRVKSRTEPWKSIWLREQARMQGRAFNGQNLTKRTYQDVVVLDTR